MKKVLLFLSLVASSYAASAQWTSQPISFASPTHLNLVISAVDANVAWTTVLDNDQGRTQLYARTTNGGANWTVQTIPGLQAFEYITDLHALDANTAYAAVAPDIPVRTGRIMKTTDGGATWTAVTTAAQFNNTDSLPFYVRFANPNQGVAIGDPVNGRFEIYTTSNGGTTWTQVPQANLPAALPDESLDNLFPQFVRLGNAMWFTTSDYRVFRSTDGGLTWNVATTGFTSSDFVTAMAFRDANNGLMLDEDGDLARTTDGGATWSFVTPSGPLHIAGLDAVPGTRTYVSVGVAGVPGGAGSSYSTNDGQTWTSIETTNNHFIVDFVSPTTGWSNQVRLNASGDISGGIGMFKYTGMPLANRGTKAVAAAPAYPNPSANGQFRVPVPANQTTDVQVRDALGRVVLRQQVKSAQNGEIPLNLSHQRAGVYSLELRSSNGLTQQKLVIQ